ncbi:hypothetical protein GRI62_12330 [Erythrobacter arachoides]|uniref:DUF5681 domain-containing protein n=1 Tax=Aurantiacibacter arachoides TaxID=1850444 RepID=A0A845A3V3_9SPHN|nr:DUF5681 domain-containing protein [Aurantiacibacter arachoides]MXO94384.1 hypothetical protein [Aurantiacibacter arachoides]GGD63899.1 hypothetical protein GCM10011411_25230 [Aurantiacibacter arachoides]
MNGRDDRDDPKHRATLGGRRKDGAPYSENNVREDGSYRVGRNRPPASGQFAVGDGRRRGRRAKGVRNADTDFERELNRRMVLKENGIDRKLTKSQVVDIRLIDNATRKGDNKAIEMVDARRRRIADAHEHNRRYHTLSDQAILEAYLLERADELAVDPAMLGDPAPEDGDGFVTDDGAERSNESDPENGNG